MYHNRHIRLALVMLFAAASATAQTPRVELSADRASLRIEVSDDAPREIELAGEGVVPIRWTRGDHTQMSFPLIVAADATPTAISVNGESRSLPADVPRSTIRIDAAAYATPWSTTDPRRWPMFAATSALALLLASRVPRRGTLAVIVVSLAITVGLFVFAARRPDVERREQGNVTWIRAREATVARVPISPGDVPVAESRSHLRSLAPRIEVDGEGRAVLDLTLGRGARVAIERH